jgi:O-antigen/teichoic acid export membrane protein
MSAAVLLIIPRLSLAAIFGEAVGGVDVGVVQSAILVAILAVVLQVPIGVVTRVRYGLQEGHISNFWHIPSTLFQLVAVGAAAFMHASLTWFVVAVASENIVGCLLDCGSILRSKRRWLRPSLGAVRGTMCRKLLGGGAQYLALGIAGAVGYQTDALIIAHSMGAEAAGVYGVCQKMFWTIPTALGFFVYATWPAYADALASGDQRWIRSTFRRSLGVAVPFAVIGSLAFVVFAERLLRLWLHADVEYTPSLLWAFSGLVLVTAISGPLAMLLNGIGALRVQVVCASVMAVVNFFLSLKLVGPWGAAGPVVATVVAQTLCIIVPVSIYLRRRLVI